jgi:hypothetical protein
LTPESHRGVEQAALDLLDPASIVSIPTDKLGEMVESLGKEGPQIIAALGELLTQAWK